MGLNVKKNFLSNVKKNFLRNNFEDTVNAKHSAMLKYTLINKYILLVYGSVTFID